MKHYQVSVFFEYEIVLGYVEDSIMFLDITAYNKEEAQDKAYAEMSEIYDNLTYCEYYVEEV